MYPLRARASSADDGFWSPRFLRLLDDFADWRFPGRFSPGSACACSEVGERRLRQDLDRRFAYVLLNGAEPDPPLALTRRDKIAAVLIGCVGGFVVGLTSVGTGVFFGLTLLVVFPRRARKVVGTDIFHAAALLYVAGFEHFIAGNVDLTPWPGSSSGQSGVLLGTQLSLSVSDRLLRAVLAVVLGLSGLRLLNVPGTTDAIIAVLGTGMLLLLVSIGRQS